MWSAKVDKLTRTLAVTASGDFTAKLWCATTGKELFEFKHKHVVKSVDFSADTEQFVSGCQDGLLRIFRTAEPSIAPREIKVAGDLSDAVTKCLWTPSQNMILLGKRSGVVELWDVREGFGSPVPAISAKVAENQPVMDVELNSNDLLTAASGTTVYRFSFSTIYDSVIHLRNNLSCLIAFFHSFLHRRFP